MRPTLKDVAERAGVSVSTVSYVLNDSSKVVLSAETRARVRRIAKDLGYIPNSVARSLRSRSSRIVGMLVTKPLTNPRFAAIVQGASVALAEERMHLTILSDPSGGAYLEDYRSGRLDGIVFVGHDDESVPEAFRQAAREGLPFVALDCGAPDAAGTPYSTVDFDYSAGARQMIEHVAERGFRVVLHVHPEVPSRANRQREQALLRALADHPSLSLRVVSTGLTGERLREFERSRAHVDDYAREVAERVGAAIGSEDEDPGSVAVVCSWGADVEAVMSTERVRENRIFVGALAGGTPSPRIWPGLAYSRLPLERAGAESARLLMQEIREGAHEHLVLQPELDAP
ncbi:LacI family DNA-binding transcriptional regulator [Saccharopolyspora sp. TS4A08]|uniref:LacI family DNA-binding transcriptional regulator n=1 Tax=Saccharopolyspora ipomoeae TaxID=3042027 RepID=A0ABT6PJR9_9PSEU|nr:LacI family DNA-binding transcriptional regulator [Saccharopolyspora sp. TS4A08]MDI2028192.1 LacI family DNA-binding transcriptional regulator [Saccharopolyspora sp. TS4A08]